MHNTSRQVTELMDWFLTPLQTRCPENLDKQIKAALRQNLDHKHLNIILLHTAIAIKEGKYGAQTEGALEVVDSHIEHWSSKFTNALNRAQNGKKREIARGIAESLRAFKELKLKIPETLWETIQQKTQEEIKNFTSIDISDTLSATAQTSMPVSDGFINALLDQIEKMGAKAFHSDQTLKIMHALATIDAVQVIHTGKGRENLAQAFKKYFKDNTVRAKLADALEDAPEKTRAMLDAYYWFYGHDFPNAEYPEEQDTISPFESEVAGAFRNNGAQIHESTTDPNTKQRIDLRMAFAEKAFAQECDGPTHFLRCPWNHTIVPNGSTIFQTLLKTRRDPELLLLRLAYRDFHLAPKDSETWAQIRDAIQKAEPGAYILNVLAGKLTSLSSPYGTPTSEQDT